MARRRSGANCASPQANRPWICGSASGGTGQCVRSDASGRFAGLDARPGQLRLEVSLPSGEVLLTGEVETRAGLTSEVLLELPDLASVEASVTVTASALLTPDEVVTSGVRIQNREIARAAGTLQDVSRYVATLPGVVTGSADFRNDIIVRGGSPLENLFVVDNIEIPNINSFANLASMGGTSSLLDVQLIEDVTFLTGGYPAPYVNRLSSVMQIAQREGSREEFKAMATVAFAGAGVVLEGPWSKGKGSWIVSARRSYLDFFTEDLGTGGVPVYSSFTVKAVRDFGVRDRIWATSVTGLDRIRLGLTEDSQPEDELSNFDISYRGFRSATGVNWQRLHGTRGVGLLGFSWSQARVDSTVKHLLAGGLLGAEADIERIIELGVVAFRQDSSENEVTVKYDLTLHARSIGEYRLGGSVKRFANDYDMRSRNGYSGPYAQQRGGSPVDLREGFGANQASAYLQTTHTVAQRVRLTFGGRFDRYSHYGLAPARFSPRAGAMVALTENLSFGSSWGIYHQLPFYLFVAALPENRRLIPARSEHWVSGLTWTPHPSVRLTVEGYAKRYKDYPVSIQYPQLSFANEGDTFDVRDVLYPMASVGRGQVRGVEFFAEKKSPGRWFGQLNLSYSRARHAGLDQILRPGAYDRPIVFNAVGGRRLGSKWELGLRMSYLTGRPRTPFNLALSRAQRRAIFDLDRLNAERYSPFFTLDLRVDRSFRRGDQVVIVYGGVQNVTGRANQLAATWSRRINEPSFNTGLGSFPIFGLEWAF